MHPDLESTLAPHTVWQLDSDGFGSVSELASVIDNGPVIARSATNPAVGFGIEPNETSQRGLPHIVNGVPVGTSIAAPITSSCRSSRSGTSFFTPVVGAFAELGIASTTTARA